ncbi:MAG: hypothetical protein ACP5QT_07065 [Brevinematia bacterium]
MRRILEFVFLLPLLLFSEETSLKLANIFKLFSEKRYEEITSNYPLEKITNSETFLERKTDILYIYAISFFATGEYSNSIKVSELIAFSNQNLTELKFFNYLNTGDLNKARLEVKKIQVGNDNLFYNSIINFSEGKFSDGVENLKGYLLSEKSKKYNIEALLLDYTISFRKENFNFLIDIIKKNCILEKDFSDEIATIDSKATSSPFNDFLEYRRIVEGVERDGDKEKTKRAFMSLIKNTSSAIIKNLASFEYQRLE